MRFVLIKIITCLTLLLFTTRTFSHPGHTSLIHSHTGIELLLALLALLALIYTLIKR